MSELITCTALMAFSRFVSGHGIIHGDPDNKGAKKVRVPEHAVDLFIEEGFIEKPKGYKSKKEAEPLPGAPVADDSAPVDGGDTPPVEGGADAEEGAPV